VQYGGHHPNCDLAEDSIISLLYSLRYRSGWGRPATEAATRAPNVFHLKARAFHYALRELNIMHLVLMAPEGNSSRATHFSALCAKIPGKKRKCFALGGETPRRYAPALESLLG
jgi:hypothetical protein